ncbi:MAG: hypothetical protein K2X35_00725 [Bryobacteraceae bacterium]|nr:hypothetical protein [Bryobacteraceae bacterium]
MNLVKLAGMAELNKITRRSALGAIAVTALVAPGELEATPDEPETEHEGDGPFYKPGAPERNVFLESGIAGTPFLLQGRVLDVTGKPVANALIDLWHADSSGEYDNQGWKLRGRFRTDGSGGYTLKTIQPKWYKAGNIVRAAHFHVKVSGATNPLLTTALYFEGDPYLNKDGMVKKSLILDVKETKKGRTADFTFVLRKA